VTRLLSYGIVGSAFQVLAIMHHFEEIVCPVHDSFGQIYPDHNAEWNLRNFCWSDYFLREYLNGRPID
jgi:hypothetical protein